MNRKIAVSLALVIVLVFASIGTVFADIDYSQWNSNSAYPSDVVNTNLFTPVKFLIDKKVIQGYEDGLFHPERSITRAEYIKMLLISTNNTSQLGSYSDCGLSDVSGHWGETYIEAGVALGFINGYPDGTFRPDDAVSYAEMGAMFLRTKHISDTQLNAYGKWPANVEKYLNMYNMASTITVNDWNDDA